MKRKKRSKTVIGQMVRSLARWVLPVVIASITCQVNAADAYFARHIWTGEGPPIHDGVLLVEDGKVVAVGTRDSVKLPPNVRRHDWSDSVIIPGLVIAETELAERSRDDERAMTPEVVALDGFDLFADRQELLAGGVTTVSVVPGSRRLIPGQASVVKLAGEDLEARTLVEQESLRILLSQSSRNPPKVFEPPVGAVSVQRPLLPTNAQLAATLGGSVAGLRAVLRASQDPGALARGRVGENGDSLAESDAGAWLAVVSNYMNQARTMRVTAMDAAEIRAALGLAKEFNLSLLLVDPQENQPLLASIGPDAKAVRGVVVSARIRPGQVTSLPIPDEDRPPPPLPWELARDLVRAGVKVALKPAADDDLDEMLFLGGVFTRGPLSPAEVLRMITLTPAELLGVGNRVGSLAAGKDADFLKLADDPFADRTHVLATYVNGRKVAEAVSEAKTRVVTASAIYRGNGRVVANGSLVIEGTKIQSLGSDVSAPVDAVYRRFPQGVIVPGYIDLATGLGIGGQLSGTIPLQAKLGEQLYSGDPAVPVARRGGVTTVLLGGSGSAPTPMVAFKLGDHLRVLKDPAAVRFEMSGNLTTQAAGLRRILAQGKSYADAWTKYEAQKAEYDKQLPEYEKQLKEYEAAKAKYEAAKKESKPAESKSDGESKSGAESKSDGSKTDQKTSGESKAGESKSGETKSSESKSDASSGEEPKPPTKLTEPSKPSTNASLEPFRELFAGRIPALVEARQTTAMAEAVKVFQEEFKLRTVLIGADDAVRDPSLLVGKDIGVSAGPTLIREIDQRLLNLPQILANHQVPFGFQSQATTGVQTLPVAVQYAVHRGLGKEDALRAFTATPAKFLGLGEQLGSLEVGKDADLVVLSGPPFELSTEVLAVMIDGEWVYEKEAKR